MLTVVTTRDMSALSPTANATAASAPTPACCMPRHSHPLNTPATTALIVMHAAALSRLTTEDVYRGSDLRARVLRAYASAIAIAVAKEGVRSSQPGSCAKSVSMLARQVGNGRGECFHAQDGCCARAAGGCWTEELRGGDASRATEVPRLDFCRGRRSCSPPAS